MRINLYTTLDQSDSAVEVGLDYLRRVDGQWSQHATEEDIRQEYDRLWQRLEAGSIEALLDLPLMSDPDRRATMDVLTALLSPAQFTDLNLYRLVIVRMAAHSLEHGNSDGAPLAYVRLGSIRGMFFGDYQGGARLAKVGLDLVERPGFERFRARVYVGFGVHVSNWTQPLDVARAYLRRAFEAAQESGDISFAAYSCIDMITNLLAAGTPLSEVEREAEKNRQIVQRLKFAIIRRGISEQLAIIRMLRGQVPTARPFRDAVLEADEHEDIDPGVGESIRGADSAGVRDLRHRTARAIGAIRELQARAFMQDFAGGVAAVMRNPPLWAVPTQFERAEYQFHEAISRAALCDSTMGDERHAHLEAVAEHHRQLAIWAKNCPSTFANRAALIGAEIARLEGREPMRCVSTKRPFDRRASTASSRTRAWPTNSPRGSTRRAASRRLPHAYLRNARSCYLRWGAEGKVRQLEQLHPHLREESAPPPPTATFGAPVEQLDVGTVVKASQAVSGEIELGKLIETLMRIAIEHAGAERGLLILLRGDEPQIVAEATAGHGRVEVTVREAAVSPSALPQSALHYVMRTRESVVLDDASVRNLYSDDEYIRQKHPRSVLCLPVVKQTKLVGALYLENNLTPYAFTSSRVAVLELLASQAAISLENARLYSERKRAEDELRRSEAYLAEAQRLSRTGSFGWSVATGEIIWSDETFRIFGYDKAPSVTIDMVVQRTHPDDRAAVQQTIDRAARDGKDFSHEYRLLMPDGSVRHVHAVAHAVKDASGNIEFVGAVTDVTATKRAEDALRESEQRFRDYAEIASDWLWETGPDHRFIHLSEQLAAIGISPARPDRLEAMGFRHRPR